MKKYMFIGAVGWVACGIAAAGGEIAYCQARFSAYQTPDELARDAKAHIGVGILFGPAHLLITTLRTGFFHYGWTLSMGKR